MAMQIKLIFVVVVVVVVVVDPMGWAESGDGASLSPDNISAPLLSNT